VTPSRNRPGSARTALVIAQDRLVFETVSNSFKGKRAVDETYSIDIALELLRARHYDFLFIDLEILRGRTGGNGYKTALQPFWLAAPDLEIIVMAPQEEIREAVMAVKAGASNYLTYPLAPDEVKYVADSIYESIVMQSEFEYLRDKFWESDSLEIVQTRSPAMKQVFEKVRLVAPTNSTVLISGDTGTGKSVLAKLIHRHSNRKNGPFISLHCGAIPETLLESELFGHEKGSFTGGTIFLDEIADLPPLLQVKLLRVTQEKTFRRVGGTEDIRVDVRIISATNKDLQQRVHEGRFREDLYYRLNVIPIHIPPLRERKDDIPILTRHFIEKYSRQFGKKIQNISTYALELLVDYPFPGNIRELENIIERSIALEASSIILPENLVLSNGAIRFEAPGTGIDIPPEGIHLNRELARVEKAYIDAALEKTSGSRKMAADLLNITLDSLHYRIDKLSNKAS